MAESAKPDSERTSSRLVGTGALSPDDEGLVGRLRAGVWISAATISAFVVNDLVEARSEPAFVGLIAMKLLEVILLGWASWRLGIETSTAGLTRVGVAIVSGMYVGGTMSGWIRGDTAPNHLLLVACTIATATFFPWSWRAQLASVAAACVVLLPNPLVSIGWVAPAAPRPILSLTIGTLVAFSGSVYLAAEHERERRARRRMAILLEEQRRALERIAHGEPLPSILDDVCRLIQQQSSGLLCSVLLLDGHQLRNAAAPDLPRAYSDAIEGFEIGPERGSCGSSAYLKQPVVVEDTQRDRRWHEFRELAAEHDLRACTSTPILAGDGHCLGTFAAYHREPHRPTPEEWTAFEIATGIARIAIERSRAEAELLRTRVRIEEESRVSRALVRVGRHMISSLSTAELLHRLCELTTQELDCDCAATVISDCEARQFRISSTFGYPADLQAQLATMEMSSPVMERLAEALRTSGPLEFSTHRLRDAEASELLTSFGIRRALYIPIRRGHELVGILAANRRHRDHRFGEIERRVAEGMAQIASVALENARLVERLEAADRIKSEFVSTMSHELRTPVSVIIGYTEMLRDEGGDPTRQHLLERIHDSSLELLEMIQATLDLNRLETGEDQAIWERVQVGQLFEDLAGGFDALPHAQRPALRWHHEPDLELVTDRRKLRTILKNLVGNAIKFTPGGTIDVAARRSSAGVVFTVRDTGVGIAANHLPVIFQMFRQADSSDSRSYGGVGLGLYIVRRLLTQLRGDVEVDSIVGEGTTFTVLLPTEPPPEALHAPTVTTRSMVTSAPAPV